MLTWKYCPLPYLLVIEVNNFDLGDYTLVSKHY